MKNDNKKGSSLASEILAITPLIGGIIERIINYVFIFIVCEAMWLFWLTQAAANKNMFYLFILFFVFFVPFILIYRMEKKTRRYRRENNLPMNKNISKKTKEIEEYKEYAAQRKMAEKYEESKNENS